MHWSVSVERDGERVVTIETECLCGRETNKEDEEAIRTAAHHLLAFIGDPHPEVTPEPLTADGWMPDGSWAPGG